jgi:hypothetical protein
MMKRKDWKPLPPVGYPSLVQRVAALQLATRAHASASRPSSFSSSSSSSSSSSFSTRRKAKGIVAVRRHGYVIPLPREQGETHQKKRKNHDKEDDAAIPTMVTIPTTTTATTTAGTLFRHDLIHHDHHGNKFPLKYNYNQDEDDDGDDADDDNSSLLDQDDDSDDSDDDEYANSYWDYDDNDNWQDDDNDSVVKAFEESRRPRFLRDKTKDLYPREDSNEDDIPITPTRTTITTTTKNVALDSKHPE